MVDSVERLVNLALYFADARGTVTREQIRKEVAGYDIDQDEDAFLRMFERDKDALKKSGFALVSDEAGNYRLDARATYASSLDLDAREAATLRAAGAALLGDPSFPFGSDLRLALAKIAAELDTGDVLVRARLADEAPDRQGEIIAGLTGAATTRKSVGFGYTNSLGRSAPHDVEPYGVFLHDGRWYLVGRDSEKDEVRTYAVARMTDVCVNARAPKSPDFERPADFDVASFVRLPFQYGPASQEFEAAIRIAPTAVWRIRTLTRGAGRVEEAPDGGALWYVPARSAERLVRFVTENNPGLSLVGPASAIEYARSGLAKVVAAHG